MKRLLAALMIFVSSVTLAQTFPVQNLQVNGTASFAGAATFTVPVGVASGGTGAATFTAHTVLAGEGTSALVGIGPGTAGQPLLSGGASADPAYGTLGVAGGGTGLTSITAHGVMLGEGTGNVATIGPCSIGQSIIGQGASADPVCGYPTGTLIGVQVFTSSGTYTPTAGTNSIIVIAVGGGGGSGGAAATSTGQSAIGSPGGAGAYAMARFTSGFTGGLAVTIGSAGTAGTAGNNAGGSGGTTSLGSLVSCPGGTGGLGGAVVSGSGVIGPTSPTSAPTITGAAQVLASTPGVGGTAGLIITAGSQQLAGSGGGSPFGTAGLGTNGAGAQAGGKGAGASGPAIGASTSAAAGQAGTAGVLIVYEYN
jgi:hypothetical protein